MATDIRSIQSCDVVDQLTARLAVLEARCCSYTGDGVAALKGLAPDVLSDILWGFQLDIADCRALVRRLPESRLTGAIAVEVSVAAPASH
ncbi:MAG: hypothetical protein AB7P08_10335 [Burkholderiales bacterium]